MSHNDREDEDAFYDSETEPSLPEDEDEVIDQLGNMSLSGERSFNMSICSGASYTIYAVQFTSKSKPSTSTNNRIFSKQENAKKLCKEDPENRRFKAFKSFQDAYAFSYESEIESGQAPTIAQVKQSLSLRMSAHSSNSVAESATNASNSQISTPNKNLNQDVEKLPFSAPKKPEINELRSFIEKNMFEQFRDKVLSNPRFLISAGDAPVCFQLCENSFSLILFFFSNKKMK